MELSHKLKIEATMFYANTALQWPKSVEKGITIGFQCFKMRCIIKIAKKWIGKEDFCEKNLWKNLFLLSYRHMACGFTNRELLF